MTLREVTDLMFRHQHIEVEYLVTVTDAEGAVTVEPRVYKGNVRNVSAIGYAIDEKVRSIYTTPDECICMKVF